MEKSKFDFEHDLTFKGEWEFLISSLPYDENRARYTYDCPLFYGYEETVKLIKAFKDLVPDSLP